MSTPPVSTTRTGKKKQPNWRLPDGKEALVRRHYKGQMPGPAELLWFHLGGVEREDGDRGPVKITDEQMDQMRVRFFGATDIPAQAIRFARSSTLPDFMGRKPTIAIVSGAKRFHPSFTVGDIDYPLYQVGIPASGGINLIQAMTSQATN